MNVRSKFRDTLAEIGGKLIWKTEVRSQNKTRFLDFTLDRLIQVAGSCAFLP